MLSSLLLRKNNPHTCSRPRSSPATKCSDRVRRPASLAVFLLCYVMLSREAFCHLQLHSPGESRGWGVLCEREKQPLCGVPLAFREAGPWGSAPPTERSAVLVTQPWSSWNASCRCPWTRSSQRSYTLPLKPTHQEVFLPGQIWRRSLRL